MKRTFREKTISRYRRLIQQHTWLKLPVLAWLMAVLSVYDAGLWFGANIKRYSCVVLLLFFLVISSSFASPESLSAQRSGPALEEDGILLTAEQEVDAEQMAFIEADNDTFDDYDDVALLEEEELDTYTLDEILESNETYKDLVQTPETEAGELSSEGNTDRPDYSDYAFDKEDWRLLLVNKQHSIPDDYEFTTGAIKTMKGTQYCDERIIDDLLRMLQAAQNDNISLQVCSPYRTMEYQQMLFNNHIKEYMRKGLSYMEAFQLSSVAVNVPGSSEHQIGLALDIVTPSYKRLVEGFADTDAGKWLAENCYKYGFILRYPKGKEYITGIEFEPWHFRYVGVDAATVITERGITLEEFWEEL